MIQSTKPMNQLYNGSRADAGMAAASDVPLPARLRAAVDSGEIVTGGRLMPERELATALGVGRRSLRQALSELEAEGVIWRRQGHGTFVSALHPPRTDQLSEIAANTSPAELTEVRMELEPMLARFCALRAKRPQLQRLREAAEHASAVETSYAFSSADAAFHRAIAQGANNSLFLAMFESLMAVLAQAEWRAVRQNSFSHTRRVQVSHQHQDIVDSIVSRDPIAAETAMRAHLTSVYDHLRHPTR